MTATLPSGYRLVPGAPHVEDYLVLRERSGLTPKTREQAVKALPGSWRACHVVLEASGRAVAMGRVLGDGGWYFHIVDMAVLPEHQRRGLGSVVLAALLDEISAEAAPGAWVNLLADGPGRPLYARFGFTETAPESVGMGMLLPTDPNPRTPPPPPSSGELSGQSGAV
ncbi:MAG: GNAT family N-acetyltransferase [Actinobacteria bacterium]|jgi:GNAT superfamily N-acetyltransferase|nr:GNAT family N-acetyltransferase [Actinomycetota bacterium]